MRYKPHKKTQAFLQKYLHTLYLKPSIQFATRCVTFGDISFLTLPPM